MKFLKYFSQCKILCWQTVILPHNFLLCFEIVFLNIFLRALNLKYIIRNGENNILLTGSKIVLICHTFPCCFSYLSRIGMKILLLFAHFSQAWLLFSVNTIYKSIQDKWKPKNTLLQNLYTNIKIVLCTHIFYTLRMSEFWCFFFFYFLFQRAFY